MHVLQNYEFNTDPEINHGGKTLRGRPLRRSCSLLADYLSIVPQIMTDSSNCFVLSRQQRDERGMSVNTDTFTSPGRINRAREHFLPFPSHLTLPPLPSITWIFIDPALLPSVCYVLLESASENECELTPSK